MPLVTVVIATYNLEKYIRACLEDLLGQTMNNFDVLIVDDCSNDNTANIVQEYIFRNPGRIQMISLDNNLGNAGRTRNIALDSGKITGKYVVFLDGDDHIESDYLEVMLAKAEQNQADIVICAYDRIEEVTGHILCRELTWLGEDICLPPQDDIIAFLNPALWNKMIRTSCINNTHFTDIIGVDDLIFTLHVYQNCKKIATIPIELIHYRVRPGSLITAIDEKTIHILAEQFSELFNLASVPWKQVIALSSFLHIGLSMAVRAADNPKINQNDHLKWTRRYMTDTFGLFYHMQYFSLRSFCRHGMRGFVLWISLILYRIGWFRVALWAYRVIRRVFHIDIKF